MPSQPQNPSLDDIIATKRKHVQERKTETPIEAIRARASMQKRPHPVLSTVPHDAPIMMIGQVRYVPQQNNKFAHPYDPVTSAMYEVRAGVDAIDLFTDESLYEGGLDDLVLLSRAVNVPVISHDYIVDEYQIVEARAAGASALVLCSGILKQPELRQLVSSTQRNLMTAIVEVRSKEELEYALSLSPYAIALSRADLYTKEVLPIILHELRATIPSSIRVMLSDALKTLDEAREAAQLNVDAVMIHESLLVDKTKLAQLHTILRHPPYNPNNDELDE